MLRELSEIAGCRPPHLLWVTWEFGGQASWLTIRLSKSARDKTLLELERGARVPIRGTSTGSQLLQPVTDCFRYGGEKPLDPSTLIAACATALEAAGFSKNATLHSLRHALRGIVSPVSRTSAQV